MNLAPYKITTDEFKGLSSRRRNLSERFYAPVNIETFNLDPRASHLLRVNDIICKVKKHSETMVVFMTVESNSDKLYKLLNIKELWRKHAYV